MSVPDNPLNDCPPWCHTEKHEFAHPGDMEIHAADLATINLPPLPPIRGELDDSVTISVLQFFTSRATYKPLASLSFRNSSTGDGFEGFTTAEVRLLAAALVRAADFMESIEVNIPPRTDVA